MSRQLNLAASLLRHLATLPVQRLAAGIAFMAHRCIGKASHRGRRPYQEQEESDDAGKTTHDV